MRQCWQENPTDRPSFKALLWTIRQIIDRDFKERYYQNVCPESTRHVSETSCDDDAFMPPYVQIADEKVQITCSTPTMPTERRIFWFDVLLLLIICHFNFYYIEMNILR